MHFTGTTKRHFLYQMVFTTIDEGNFIGYHNTLKNIKVYGADTTRKSFIVACYRTSLSLCIL